MSTLQTSPATIETHEPPVSRARRRFKIVLVVLGALVAAAVLFSIAANVAVSTFASHDHGTLDISIDGETVDLDQPRFHDLHPQFHVHAERGNLWHQHPGNLTRIFAFEPMTLVEALSAIGADLTDDTFTFDGVVYHLADPGVSATVRVNGALVDPEAHVLADDDAITVDVVTGR